MRARVPRSGGAARFVDVADEIAAAPRSAHARLAIGRKQWSLGWIVLWRPDVLDYIDAGAPTVAILGAGVFDGTTVVIDTEEQALYLVDSQ